MSTAAQERKRVKRMNAIIEREFRKHLPFRVVREERNDHEYIYVLVGETRYKCALEQKDEFFFTALGQPSISFPVPEDYR